MWRARLRAAGGAAEDMVSGTYAQPGAERDLEVGSSRTPKRSMAVYMYEELSWFVVLIGLVVRLVGGGRREAARCGRGILGLGREAESHAGCMSAQLLTY